MFSVYYLPISTLLIFMYGGAFLLRTHFAFKHSLKSSSIFNRRRLFDILNRQGAKCFSHHFIENDVRARKQLLMMAIQKELMQVAIFPCRPISLLGLRCLMLVTRIHTSVGCKQFFFFNQAAGRFWRCKPVPVMSLLQLRVRTLEWTLKPHPFLMIFLHTYSVGPRSWKRQYEHSLPLGLQCCTIYFFRKI